MYVNYAIVYGTKYVCLAATLHRNFGIDARTRATSARREPEPLHPSFLYLLFIALDYALIAERGIECESRRSRLTETILVAVL